MTKASTRRFFFLGTLLFTLVFIGLTLHTHTTLATRTHADAITPQVARGLRVWGRYNCENCHTLLGEGSYYAPDLTHLMSRRTLASGTVPNTRDQLRQWIADPGQEKPGCLMPAFGLSDRDLDSIVDYLSTLH